MGIEEFRTLKEGDTVRRYFDDQDPDMLDKHRDWEVLEKFEDAVMAENDYCIPKLLLMVDIYKI